MATDLQVQPGDLLSGRYELKGDLGGGPLARVYLARDRKHGRQVAIKVLRPEFAHGLASKRFHREIGILASLHHPHILPLLDSGEVDGTIFFTMPYASGETLQSRIGRASVLPIPEAIRIARQVASALSYAHARGVVHRDIKPANILVTEDLAQVADFGIAYALLSAAGDRVTETGISIGTPAYMSPEQADGTKEVDGRSDLYSLGCVLFEMLVGEPPFTGPTVQAILSRHRFEPMPSIRTARPTVPRRLESLVRHALAKQPADRHGGVAEFAAELAEIETEIQTGAITDPGNGTSTRVRPGSRERQGIVVIPFLNLCPNQDDAFLSSGLTDEIITSLSGLEALRVISHTSAMQLEKTTRTPRQLGSELGVQFVLEGSVQRAGPALRVATRLVSAQSEELVWGRSYEGEVSSLFELEKRISRDVVEALSVRTSSGEQQRLTHYRITDTRAFEYFLRARQQIYTFTGEGLERALVYLKKAAEASEDNPVLWAAMGYVYWQFINAGISADPAYFQRARECADRVVRLDPGSPEARRLLGLIEIHAKGDPQVAVDHLKAALEVNPNDPDALFWLSLIYGCVGRPSSGYPLAIRLLDIDPLTPLHHVVPGFLDVLDGDPQRALPWLSKAHELDRANPIVSIAYGQALGMCGAVEEATGVLTGIANHVPGSFFAQLGRAFSLALARTEDAGDALSEDVLENARRDLQYSWTLAQCYAMLGRAEEACDWVGNAVQQGFWNYPLLAERDPLLAAARGHPRFAELMAGTRQKWLDFRA